MTASVMLDTSYLISLVDKNRPNHDTAFKYYKHMLEHELPMYFSSVVAAEFGIKQPITDLPIRNFRQIPFNIPHGVKTAAMWNALGGKDPSSPRHVARDDIKLLAQAAHESIPFILTEDASTLHKYCERLRAANVCDVRSVVLVNGYSSAAFNSDGQMGLC